MGTITSLDTSKWKFQTFAFYQVKTTPVARRFSLVKIQSLDCTNNVSSKKTIQLRLARVLHVN